jgi:PIN domain nuclease of toxin-antitoxin system
LILLDTHVLIWLDSADSRLGADAKATIEEAHQAGEVAVSAISFWETSMLIQRGRLKLDLPIHAWREDLLSAGLHEVVLDGGIGITAATLDGFHGDPADRIIASTALIRGDLLLTADRQILEWSGTLKRLDARR